MPASTPLIVRLERELGGEIYSLSFPRACARARQNNDKHEELGAWVRLRSIPSKDETDLLARLSVGLHLGISAIISSSGGSSGGSGSRQKGT